MTVNHSVEHVIPNDLTKALALVLEKLRKRNPFFSKPGVFCWPL